MRKLMYAFILIPIISGCMVASPRSPVEYQPESVDESGQGNSERGRSLLYNEAETNQQDERLVTSSALIKLETNQPDTVHKRIIKLAERYEGYVVISEIDRTSIRLLSQHFKTAIEEIETYGKVASKRVTGKDVTEMYSDLQIRLDNAEKTRQRYLALLENARTVPEMLHIEKELERLNEKIELLKGKLNNTSHLVEYATITVSTARKISPGPIGYVFYGLYKGISWLFVWD